MKKEKPINKKDQFKDFPTTSREIRRLIIWAKREIDEYEEFISICENQIKKLRDKWV